MMCTRCIKKNCDECYNYFNMRGEKREPPTKTWCDCQHKVGVYIHPNFCHHLSMTEDMTDCPSCGKNPEDLEAQRQRAAELLEAQSGAANDG